MLFLWDLAVSTPGTHLLKGRSKRSSLRKAPRQRSWRKSCKSGCDVRTSALYKDSTKERFSFPIHKKIELFVQLRGETSAPHYSSIINGTRAAAKRWLWGSPDLCTILLPLLHLCDVTSCFFSSPMAKKRLSTRGEVATVLADSSDRQAQTSLFSWHHYLLLFSSLPPLHSSLHLNASLPSLLHLS